MQGPKPPQISPGAHLRQHEVRGGRKDLQEPTHIHHAPLHPHGNIREARSVCVGRRAPPCRAMSALVQAATAPETTAAAGFWLYNVDRVRDVEPPPLLRLADACA